MFKTANFKTLILIENKKKSKIIQVNSTLWHINDAYYSTYSRNNMGQKCEGNCGLWVLNKTIKNIYPEILKKIMGAVWELPAK